MIIHTLFLFLLAHGLFDMSRQDTIESGVYHWPSEVDSGTSASTLLAEGSTSALSHLQVIAARLEPAASYKRAPEFETYEELLIVKEGFLSINDATTEQVVGRGSAIVLMPDERYAIANKGASPATFYLFRYHARALPDSERGVEAGGSIIADWDKIPFRKTDKGGRRQQFDRPTTMFERFEMHVTTLNAGITSHPPHTHREEEFILVLDGDVEEQIDDGRYRASAGDVIFLAAESLHTIKNVGDKPTEYFAFKWE